MLKLIAFLAGHLTIDFLPLNARFSDLSEVNTLTRFISDPKADLICADNLRSLGRKLHITNSIIHIFEDRSKQDKVCNLALNVQK